MHPGRAGRILLDPVAPDFDIAGSNTRTSAPRRAFCFNASCERWRNSDSSSSLIVPFIPSNKPIIGMPRIVDSVLVDDDRSHYPQNSINVCQSRPLRASRDTSIASTAPTRASQIAASKRSKPAERCRRPNGQDHRR